MESLSTLRMAYEPRIARGAQSEFQEELLGAAINNLEALGPLRINNFAYSLREFFRHLLLEAAPATEVAKCNWFSPVKGATGGVTRAHRAKYAIQGGLSDKFLGKKLGFEGVNEVLTELAKSQNTLRKYTHIEPDTFGVSDAETNKVAKKCLEAAASYVERIIDCRSSVRDALTDHIDQHLLDEIVSNGIAALGELATHAWTDDHVIEGILINGISATTVLVHVSGTVDVVLQYGSDADVKRDMG